MKKILLLILLASPSFAAGPKYNFSDPHLNDELVNIYKDIGTLLKGGVHISSISISGVTYPALKYVQIVSSTTQTATTTTSSTFQSTALAMSITPLSASNKVKITVSCDTEVVEGLTQAALRLTIFRGATNLGDATTGLTTFFENLVNGTVRVPVSMIYIDSPATTSATNYDVKICNSDNSTTVKFPSAALPLCSIILEEFVP